MTKAPFKLGQRTRALVAYLRLIEKGAEVSYLELQKHVGEPITAANSTYARKILQRDYNSVFTCLPKVGLRRLIDREIAERLPAWWMTTASRKLHRGGHQADVVEMKELSIDEQARFSVAVIQRELASDALSKRTTKRLEKVSRGTSNDLPAFTAVEWAISLMPRRDAPK